MTSFSNTLRGLILFIFISSIFLWVGCSDENISSNPNYKLSFSRDSLSFDTVFSTIGSTTSGFAIYNRNSKEVSISSITLTNGATTGFHMVVDGTIPANNQLSNIEIRAHDSLYVFVSVTVNPTKQDNPLLLKDSIICITNGNRQSVQLQAYGQDVEIFRSKTIHNDTTLSGTKPYLIYDYLAIDKDKTLTIKPGSTLYFHKNASLKVIGNLKAEGEPKARILFRGDRLDKLFDNVPYNYLSGQWNGIHVLGAQSTVSLDFVTMNSGKTAILITNPSATLSPSIVINHTRIQNFDSCGIASHNANLTLWNSEISNCRSGCLSLMGGNYAFVHNTIANFYNDIYAGKRRDGTPSVMLFNYNNDKHAPVPTPVSAEFINCVITGSMPNEIMISDTTRSTPLKYSFDHCYLMSNPIHSPFIKNVVWGNTRDQLFVRTTINKDGYYDFRPTEESLLRKKADIQISRLPAFCFDLNDIYRLWENAPDVGAYQWQGK